MELVGSMVLGKLDMDQLDMKGAAGREYLVDAGKCWKEVVGKHVVDCIFADRGLVDKHSVWADSCWDCGDMGHHA